jgi:hypothetical protein
MVVTFKRMLRNVCLIIKKDVNLNFALAEKYFLFFRNYSSMKSSISFGRPFVMKSAQLDIFVQHWYML